MRNAGLRIAAIAAMCALIGCENPFGADNRAPATGYYEIAPTHIAATGRTVVGFNKRGDIALNDGTSAFRYRDGVLMQLQGLAGATSVGATDMNESGVVIGRSGATRMRWTVASTTPAQAPIPNRQVVDINNAGDAIFGSTYYSQSAGRDTAFIVWNAAGAVETINVNLGQFGGLLSVWGMNDSREIAWSYSSLHTTAGVFSTLGRQAPLAGNCSGGSTFTGWVAFNDSGAGVITGGPSECLVRSGKPNAALATFTTGRPLFNNNFWIAGHTREGAIPVLATHPDTVVVVGDLFARAIDRLGWTIERFAALNDNNEILAVATRNGPSEFVVLKPRK